MSKSALGNGQPAGSYRGCAKREASGSKRMIDEGSITAIRAIGAAFEGVLRAHMIVQNGRVRDSALFSITKDDWSAVKRQLQQRLDR
jgi:hypothetical protein